jgi:hypothetical protein
MTRYGWRRRLPAICFTEVRRKSTILNAWMTRYGWRRRLPAICFTEPSRLPAICFTEPSKHARGLHPWRQSGKISRIDRLIEANLTDTCFA